MCKLIPAFVVFAVAGIVCSAATAADPSDMHLIPWPKSVTAGPGYMPLTAERRVVAGDDKLKPLADVLAGESTTLTGWTRQVTTGPMRAGDIVLKRNPALQSGEPILMLKNRDVVRSTDGAHTVAIGEQAVVEGFDYR